MKQVTKTIQNMICRAAMLLLLCVTATAAWAQNVQVVICHDNHATGDNRHFLSLPDHTSREETGNMEIFVDTDGTKYLRLDPDYEPVNLGIGGKMFTPKEGFTFGGWGLGGESFHKLKPGENTFVAHYGRWACNKNNSGTQCYIKFEGYSDLIKTWQVPETFDGATVIGYNVTFDSIPNLEVMNIDVESQINYFPNVSACKHFRQVNTDVPSGTSKLPQTIAQVANSAFRGTSLKELILPNVTYVGIRAFEDCDSLVSVTFKKAAAIDAEAFSKIDSHCTVSYDGNMSEWPWDRYQYSPNLVVSCKDGKCGWCGDKWNNTLYQDACLFWTQKSDTLTINGIQRDDFYETYGEKQMIKSHSWDNGSVKKLLLNHVYALGTNEFKDYKNISEVYLNPSLTAIGDSAFYGCSKLKDLYFDGTPLQWNAVKKGEYWKGGADSTYVVHYSCTVSFDANGHGTAPASLAAWTDARINTPADLTADGCLFTGWYTDGSCTTKWDFSSNIVSCDTTLYAGWEECVRCTVSFDANGHGTAPEPLSTWSKMIIAEPDYLTADGYLFTGWYTDAACTTKWDFESNVVFSDTTLYAGWAVNVTFNDASTNDLTPWDGKLVNARLEGRTIYKDDCWNTLCLPFSLTSLAGTPLEGYTVKELDTENVYDGHVTGLDNGTLYLNFKDATSIEAGRPCLVKKYDEVRNSPEWMVPYDSNGYPKSYEFNSDDVINAYIYSLSFIKGTYFSMSWNLYAKLNENDEWKTLDSHANETLLYERMVKFTIPNDNKGSYKYFLFEVTQCNLASDPGNNIYFQVYGVSHKTYTHTTENPTFNCVTINGDAPAAVTSKDGMVSFRGTYDVQTFTAADKNSVLLMDVNNKLRYAGNGAGLGAFRAYFKIGEDGNEANAKAITSFKLNFGDGEDEATGIISTTDCTDYTDKADAWHTVSGIRLNGKPSQKGMYIHNGKTVVVE